MMHRRVCAACGRVAGRSASGCLGCGRAVLVREAAPAVEELGDAFDPEPLWPVDGVLGRACSGLVPAWGLWLVHGPPGSGKSTAAMQLVGELGARHAWKAAWIDGEQGRSQVDPLWHRVGRGARVAIVDVRDEDALPSLGDPRLRGRAIVVVDSVHRMPGDLDEVAAELLAWGETRLVVALAHESTEGRPLGLGALAYDGRAVTRMVRGAIERGGKCRWAPEAPPSRSRRARPARRSRAAGRARIPSR